MEEWTVLDQVSRTFEIRPQGRIRVHNDGIYDFVPMKPETDIYSAQKFRSYLTKNTLPLRHKDQSGNNV